MKLKLLIIALFVQLAAFSHKDSAIIKGVVMSVESKKTIKNAYVHLISSKGERYQYKTDSTGNYHFHFLPEGALSCTLTIASDKWTTSGNFRNLGFLASKDQAVFELQAGHTYEKNFELRDIPFCGPIAPALLFYTNSLMSCNDSLRKKDSTQYYADFNTVLNTLYMALKEEPGIVIEINAHASTIEKNPQQLSLQRADHVRQLLIAKGINPKRIEVKSFGKNKLLVTDATIKKAKTQEDKMSLHLKNQRVVFRTINWDFKE